MFLSCYYIYDVTLVYLSCYYIYHVTLMFLSCYYIYHVTLMFLSCYYMYHVTLVFLSCYYMYHITLVFAQSHHPTLSPTHTSLHAVSLLFFPFFHFSSLFLFLSFRVLTEQCVCGFWRVLLLLLLSPLRDAT